MRQAVQEMFLLVDADTELQDVEQVEVNFKRHEELDLPTAWPDSSTVRCD